MTVPPGTDRRLRVPIVLQVDEAESGAACLAMMLRHLDRTVPLPRVVAACEVAGGGTTAEVLVEAATAFGLRPTVHEGSLATVAAAGGLPQIVRWGSGWVVLEGYDATSVRIVDPDIGYTTVSLEEAEHRYRGTAVSVEPGPDFVTGSETTPLLTDLRHRLRPARGGLYLAIIAGLFLIIPGLVLPLVVTQLATAVLDPHSGTDALPLFLALGASAALIGTLTLLQGWFQARAQARMTILGSYRLVDHLLRLPVRYFAQRQDGMAGVRLDQVSVVYDLLTLPLVTAGVSLVGLVVYGGVMIAFSPVLAAIVVGALLLDVAVLLGIARRQRGLRLVVVRQATRLASVGVGVVSTIEAVKASGGEDAAFERWGVAQAAYLRAGQRVGRLMAVPAAVPTLLGGVTALALLAVGATSVIDGTLSLGVLVGFQALAVSFLAPVPRLADLLRQLRAAQARLVEINDVLDTPQDPRFAPTPEVLEPGEEAGLSPWSDLSGTCTETLSTTAPGGSSRATALRTPLRGALELRDVEFGYARTGPPSVSQVCLVLPPGHRVALVGASGSGKSTVVKLVLGLHQPWSGDILVDGLPRDAWDRHHLTQSVTSVDQRITLFEGTVRDNLTLWDPSIEIDQLIAAAQDACIHEDIVTRAGGYDSPVLAGGRNFSGGQRQRLEIARALVMDPAILILDEATSALDTETEARIHRNLRRRGATCLVVAHRLSTIRDCDEIVVLDSGRVVDRGTHEDLLHRGGPYADLVEAE